MFHLISLTFQNLAMLLAGAKGVEPLLSESKSDVLPLHHAPVLCSEPRPCAPMELTYTTVDAVALVLALTAMRVNVQQPYEARLEPGDGIEPSSTG